MYSCSWWKLKNRTFEKNIPNGLNIPDLIYYINAINREFHYTRNGFHIISKMKDRINKMIYLFTFFYELEKIELRVNYEKFIVNMIYLVKDTNIEEIILELEKIYGISDDSKITEEFEDKLSQYKISSELNQTYYKFYQILQTLSKGIKQKNLLPKECLFYLPPSTVKLNELTVDEILSPVIKKADNNDGFCLEYYHNVMNSSFDKKDEFKDKYNDFMEKRNKIILQVLHEIHKINLESDNMLENVIIHVKKEIKKNVEFVERFCEVYNKTLMNSTNIFGEKWYLSTSYIHDVNNKIYMLTPDEINEGINSYTKTKIDINEIFEVRCKDLSYFENLLNIEIDFDPYN